MMLSNVLLGIGIGLGLAGIGLGLSRLTAKIADRRHRVRVRRQ